MVKVHTKTLATVNALYASDKWIPWFTVLQASGEVGVDFIWYDQGHGSETGGVYFRYLHNHTVQHEYHVLHTVRTAACPLLREKRVMTTLSIDHESMFEAFYKVGQGDGQELHIRAGQLTWYSDRVRELELTEFASYETATNSSSIRIVEEQKDLLDKNLPPKEGSEGLVQTMSDILADESGFTLGDIGVLMQKAEILNASGPLNVDVTADDSVNELKAYLANAICIKDRMNHLVINIQKQTTISSSSLLTELHELALQYRRLVQDLKHSRETLLVTINTSYKEFYKTRNTLACLQETVGKLDVFFAKVVTLDESAAWTPVHRVTADTVNYLDGIASRYVTYPDVSGRKRVDLANLEQPNTGDHSVKALLAQVRETTILQKAQHNMRMYLDTTDELLL